MFHRSCFPGVFSVACLFNLTSTTVSLASAIWGPVYDSASNANLYVVSKGTWTQDEAAAQQMGGNLATIHSAAENAFIVSNVLQNFTGEGGPNLSAIPVWIGLYDPTGAAVDDGPGGPSSRHAANFVWVDGSTSSYRNWNASSGEPNDSVNGIHEYYTSINWFYAGGGVGPGNWDDDPLAGSENQPGNTNGPYYGLVSVPVPEPSTLVLLGMGAVSLLAYAWRKRRTA